MQPFYVVGMDQGGLVTDKKPYLLVDQAFQRLDNAYVFRQRVRKREGLEFLGRLQRQIQQVLINPVGAGLLSISFTDYLHTTLGLLNQPDAELVPGQNTFAMGAPDNATFTDNGDGTFTVTGNGNAATSSINYATGDITLGFLVPTIGGGILNTTTNYFPNLPVMGIWQRDLPTINIEQTVFFDTVYAYIFVGGAFQEFIPGTTWSGTDSDFFWSTNYRGATDDIRLFFTTNFVVNAANPMRYTDAAAAAWTTFTPVIADNPPSAAQSLLFQARILIPYFGRLIALNTFEGTTAGGFVSAQNFFNRARFSQIGDPSDQANGWRQDIFGRGGFIDAPTNEAIISASFFKNTLIVGFERSTWQLRYVGEYGLPFLWERISSDFGTESTFSSILFDQGVATVGNRAITSATDVSVNRIDEPIPDQVFQFRNKQNGVLRVIGIRDFERELAFWCYSDAFLGRKFPNKTLVYNYRNNTYANFRNNVTFFGIFQLPQDVTWDSFTTFWDDQDVLWDDVQDQEDFERIVSGNQQGYVHYYGYTTLDEPSLFISNINLILDPFVLTVPNHNLETGESVYLTDALFVNGILPTPTNINDKIYQVRRIDDNNISLLFWDTNLDPHQYVDVNYTNIPTFLPLNTATYIGGGQLTLLPKLDIITKDFSPFNQIGQQVKLIYTDFLMEATVNAAFTIVLNVNTSQDFKANVLVGSQNSETNLPAPFYVPGSDIAWHRFYGAAQGQFVSLNFTLDDDLMNTLEIHQSDWELNAMTLYFRTGGKSVF